MVQAQGPSGARGYAYNGDGLRVADEQRRYIWDWAAPVPELLSDGESLYLISYETLGWQSGAAWTYALPDALGSARQHVDATGAVAVVRAWTPYGEELGGAQVGLGFTGEWFDAAVGLTYLRARWYDGAQNNAGRAITFGCTLSCRMACDWEI